MSRSSQQQLGFLFARMQQSYDNAENKGAAGFCGTWMGLQESNKRPIKKHILLMNTVSENIYFVYGALELYFCVGAGADYETAGVYRQTGKSTARHSFRPNLVHAVTSLYY